MKLEYLSDSGSSRLLLVFAGWSTGPSAFASLECPGYDIAVAFDYTDFNMPPLARDYGEVVVMAWSLGVHAAELALKSLPLTLTLAVNGTPVPVNDTLGIPENIFRLTAQNLSEPNLTKFRRRMGAASLPRGERSIDSLRGELLNFPVEPVGFRWDRAVISRGDLIFPPANQRAAWSGRAEITEIDGPHMPDFQALVNEFVINKQLVCNRFAKGRTTYAGEADVQQRMARHLFDLWQKHSRHADRVLEIGVGCGLFTEIYAPRIKPRELTLWDIAQGSTAFGPVEQADAEHTLRKLPAGSLDAIAAASTMQWFNSPAAFLLECARVLAPGGLAVLSTFGPKTFAELTAAGVTPLPYLGEDSLRRIIPSEFEILELHSGLITKVFAEPADALRHIRATGVNARPARCGVRSLINSYPRRPDGKVSLTYQPIYLILRKK